MCVCVCVCEREREREREREIERERERERESGFPTSDFISVSGNSEILMKFKCEMQPPPVPCRDSLFLIM